MPSQTTRRARVVGFLVVALIIGVLVGVQLGSQTQDAQPLEAGILTDPQAAAGPDPFEVYEAAREAGDPTYVLFYSGACQPCVEAEEKASRILPEYDGEITYVLAHTVDPRSRPLFDEFSFQSVPTMFFIAGDGRMLGMNVGPLDDDELRGRLGVLVDSR